MKKLFIRPERFFGRFFKGTTKKRDRPTLFLELLFDVVVVVVLGGISSRTILWLSAFDTGAEAGRYTAELTSLLEGAAPRVLSFYCLELMTTLIIWGSVTYHMLRYRDSVHLRLTVFTVMIPFLLTAASSYLVGTPEDFSEDNFAFFFRMNVFAHAVTTLVVGAIFLFHALGTTGSDRKHNLFIGLPFLVVGAIIIPLISGLLAAFGTYSPQFWNSLLAIMGAQLGFIMVGQALAARKRLGSLLHVRIENVKERYNSLFLVFIGEFLRTIIEGWVEGDSRAPANIAVLIMSLCLPLLIWWRYASYVDYLDMRKAHSSMTGFAAMMVLSISLLLFVADGLSVWMRGAQQVGTITFATCALASFLASVGMWRSFKRYKESTRFVLPFWFMVAGGITLLTANVAALILALTVRTAAVPNEAVVLGGNAVYVALNAFVFQRGSSKPLTAAEFEKARERLHYYEEPAVVAADLR